MLRAVRNWLKARIKQFLTLNICLKNLQLCKGNQQSQSQVNWQNLPQWLPSKAIYPNQHQPCLQTLPNQQILLPPISQSRIRAVVPSEKSQLGHQHRSYLQRLLKVLLPPKSKLLCCKSNLRTYKQWPFMSRLQPPSKANSQYCLSLRQSRVARDNWSVKPPRLHMRSNQRQLLFSDL